MAHLFVNFGQTLTLTKFLLANRYSLQSMAMYRMQLVNLRLSFSSDEDQSNVSTRRETIDELEDDPLDNPKIF
ncbi:hypothetical protein T4E_1822 [Trichinella pseudospiralis]|uniref:Uncharacterized protein n=1 Tax=Trichinella pseudospiralis TaxID=6337 RepID=A0A0V0XF46_TRIPS|nr:hypothetical protein T4E_10408 [Trichinella pseudospiralis]KRX86438.1 hypothetical protein T4E_1822 [Trichinella pseudospiralis]